MKGVSIVIVVNAVNYYLGDGRLATAFQKRRSPL